MSQAQLTPNQLVAYNLRQARRLRGWTQEQAAARLEPHLGTLWSKATYSAAERSVDGKVVRRFDADDLIAFARTFRLPITWFFLPPGGDRFPVPDGVSTYLRVPDEPPLSRGELIGLSLGVPPDMTDRLTELARRLSRFELMEHQSAVRRHAEQYLQAFIAGALRDYVDTVPTILEKLARGLRDGVSKAESEPPEAARRVLLEHLRERISTEQAQEEERE
jgi:transcriptional regulator with XRE-family HTH domain